MRHLRDGWMPPDQRRTYYFGVDLGPRKNYTTMTVLERHWKMATPQEFLESAGRAYHGEWIFGIFEVIKAERIDLGTPYTDAADWVIDEIAKIDERLPRTLILDGSGLGRGSLAAVGRMIWRLRWHCRFGGGPGVSAWW